MIRTVASYAKINLFLHVTSRRNDGYHTLYSLMTQIELCDGITLDFNQTDIQVSCNHPDVPEDNTNLAYKAADLFFTCLKPENQQHRPGISIKIDKKIPLGGGLGGGSSNAATVLTVLNEHYQHPFSTARLLEMGLSIGADVPFFILDCPAVATGAGEQLEKVNHLPFYHLVMCSPDIHAVTADVYNNLDLKLTNPQKYNISTSLIGRLEQKKNDLVDGLHNDLEAPACRLYPGIREVKEKMALLLKRDVFMTGSGSTLFTLFKQRSAAQQAFNTLMNKWGDRNGRLFLTSFKIP